MSSTILRVLLQIFCSTRFSVVESLKLELSTPSLDTFNHLEYEDGLVFPFHVKLLRPGFTQSQEEPLGPWHLQSAYHEACFLRRGQSFYSEMGINSRKEYER